MTELRICLIPMKPLAEAKARLAGALTPEERRRLALAMLSDVIAAARGFDRVWVLNSDPEVASMAEEAGVEPQADPAPGGGLNASLNEATTGAMAAGATGVLVVAADLAAAKHEDFLALALGDGVALAPDAKGTGTNALWRSPPAVIEASFGPSSRHVHEAAAREAGVRFRVLESPRLAVDVDTADALDSVWALGPGPATRRAIEEMGLTARRRSAG